ncbi:DUF2490 domain-containing protein [Sediminicola sp. 1XM1-17]|uniref:DUF2490 domain-containing protein n=1 Tax=Sediminicola sp. 1XM1-17 TaxID=3127702 RepID=UPI0030784572
MIKASIALSFLFLSLVTPTNAQEIVLKDQGSTWFTVLNRIDLNENWSLSNEIHERFGAFLNEQATFLIRPSLDYHLNKHVELVMGYSYIDNRPNRPNPDPAIGVTENNLWEQVLIKDHIGKVELVHRFRQEHRWTDKVILDPSAMYIKDGTDFSNRFRYRITAVFPIKTFENSHCIFMQVFDELWVPQTKSLMPKSVSRNWFYAGVGYKFNAKTNIQLGYMHQLDVLEPNNYLSTPIIQTTFVKNFTL